MRSLHGLLARARRTALFGCSLLFWAVFAGAAVAQTVGYKTPSKTVYRNDGAVQVPVVLSAASTSVVTVQYGVVVGTANNPGDYTIPTGNSGTIVFPPGTTEQSIPIFITYKGGSGDKSLSMNLSNPTNASLDVFATMFSLTIKDADSTPPPSPTVQFASATYSVVEGTVDPTETDPAKKYTKAVITVSLSAASSSNVSVQYDFAAGGTATANVDYVATPGVVVIPAGQTSATFSIDIVPDNLPEDNETINLVLSSPSGATLGLQSTATLTIMDDDAPAPPSPAVMFSPDPVNVYQLELSTALQNRATLALTNGPPSSQHFFATNPLRR